MKITRDKSLVEFEPESERETEQLEQLWNLIVDCVKFNKKLVPVGEYIPSKKNLARFVIEGDVGSAEVYANGDCRAICLSCNKYFELHKHDQVPMCCGGIMEIMD